MDKYDDKEKMVTVIIPAYNESEYIAEILNIARSSSLVGEVLVIDDGSSDGTSMQALICGARVITLEKNLGKAYAMDVGVDVARYEVITFLDADVVGYSVDKLERIISPVLNGSKEMYVGIRDKKILWLNKLSRIFPIISGERTVTKNLWNDIPQHYKQNFQIEIALNFFAKMSKKGMGFELIPGVNHRKKETKYGFWKGQYQRFGMMKDIVLVSMKIYLFETVKILIQSVRKKKKGVKETIKFP